jgi:hypothetical protein
MLGCGLVCVLGLLGGCGIDIPPPSYVSVTEIAAVRHTVVELGPLHPERVGPLFAYDDEIPIAEILPGDRLLLDTIVIDVEGLPLAAENIETLWLQCGSGPCVRAAEGIEDAEFEVPCSALWMLGEYTTDSFCRLGTGSAQFEFEVPELGQEVVLDPHMSFYGVVAWDGRHASDCWAQRRGDKAQLDRCGFIYHAVTVGPVWWLMQYADSIGLYTPYYSSQSPIAGFGQPANRIPRTPELTIFVDGELAAQGRPPLPAIDVPPGAEIEIRLAFDVSSQLSQGAIVPLDGYSFEFVPEVVLSRTMTTGAIRRLGEELPVIGDGHFDYAVDPAPPLGRSRVLIGYSDARGANDILTLEFEVE